MHLPLNTTTSLQLLKLPLLLKLNYTIITTIIPTTALLQLQPPRFSHPYT